MTPIAESPGPQKALRSPELEQSGWRRRAFWGVMISFIVHGLIVATWVSRIASVKTQLRLSDGAFGVALLGTAIGSLTAIPICGSLVARWGSRRLVNWTGIGFCIALILPGVATGGVSLFFALLIFGALAGANDVAMNAQAVSTEKLLGSATMSRFHAMFSLGGIVGAGAGGLVAGYGVPPLIHLASGAALFLIPALVGPRLMIETREPSAAKTAGRFQGVAPVLIALSAIGFCIFLSEGAIADWTGIYLKQILHAGDGVAPAGYAVFSAAMAIFRLLGDAIVVRIGRAATIRWGGVLAAAGIALALSVNSIGWALAGFAAAGAGFSSIVPVVFAAGGRVSKLGEGAGVATVSGIGYLGFLAGPPAIGFISEATSLRLGLFLIFFLTLCAAILVSVVERIAGASNPFSEGERRPDIS